MAASRLLQPPVTSTVVAQSCMCAAPGVDVTSMRGIRFFRKGRRTGNQRRCARAPCSSDNVLCIWICLHFKQRRLHGGHNVNDSKIKTNPAQPPSAPPVKSVQINASRCTAATTCQCPALMLISCSCCKLPALCILMLLSLEPDARSAQPLLPGAHAMPVTASA